MNIRMKSFKDHIYYIVIYCDDSLFAFVDNNGIDFDYPENLRGVDEI